jgi:CheY-like chemotaxis protein
MSITKTCLLIDDDQDDQEIFLIALNDCGKKIKCEMASDAMLGLGKLDQATTQPPDFIFIDLNMPGMSGKQCLVELKKRDFLKEVPVVVYSTSSQPKDITEMKALGASDFITKPSSVKSLTKILSDFFDKYL